MQCNTNLQLGEYMNIELVKLAISAAALLATVVVAVLTNCRKGRANKNLSEKVKLAQIVQKIPGYICQAEEILGPGTGIAKLNFVMNKLQIDCLTSAIQFDEQGLTQEVEKVLSAPQKKEEV